MLADDYPGFQRWMEFTPEGGTIIGCLACGLLCFLCALPRNLVFLSNVIALASVCTVVTAPVSTAFFFIFGPKGGAAPRASYTVYKLWNTESDCVAKALAVLHITFAFLGQPSVPAFMADMKEPRDFPKALASSLAVQVATFGLYGSLAYCAIGSENMTSPAFKALSGPHTALIVVILMMPAVISQASLIAALLSRFIWTVAGMDARTPGGTARFGAAWWARKSVWTAMQGMSLFGKLVVLEVSNNGN